MVKIIFILFLFILVLSVVYLTAKTGFFGYTDNKGQNQPSKSAIINPVASKGMKLISPVFENNQVIPDKYACNGKNINPPLVFWEIPPLASSLVLIVDDPDASGGTWVHWVVFNISPSATDVKENSVPAGGTEGVTSFGKPGYGGPCPPSGTHHYHFKLYALDKVLLIQGNPDKDAVLKSMQNSIIAQAELVGLYSKK